MKKIILFFIIAMFMLSFSGCVSDNNLPAGRASEVRVNSGDSYWELGSGDFKYINDTTIEFIRDVDGKVYYLSTSTLIDIIVE